MERYMRCKVMLVLMGCMVGCHGPSTGASDSLVDARNPDDARDPVDAANSAPVDARTPVDAFNSVPDAMIFPDAPNPLDTPPPDATASCVYEWSAGPSMRWPPPATKSTVWFNSSGQVIRIDGYILSSDNRIVSAPFGFRYDDERRIVEANVGDEKIHYTYRPTQVLISDQLFDYLYTLVDGKAIRYEGPLSRAPEDRISERYEYDDAGRVTWRSNVLFYDIGQGPIRYTNELRYSFDEQGRLKTYRALQNDKRLWAYSFGYADSGDRLVVDISDSDSSPSSPLAYINYEFDASRRIVRIWSFSYQFYIETVDFHYSEGQIEAVAPDGSSVRATGQCKPPAVFGPKAPPLPIRPWSNQLDLPDPVQQALQLY